MGQPQCFDLSRPEGDGADWTRIGAMVCSATANPSGLSFRSPVRCFESSGDRRCGGYLWLRRLDLPSEIRSRCSRCTREGQIVHWRKSPWDLSDWARYQIEEVVVWVTPKEYETLAGCQTLDRPTQVAVFRSRPHGKRIRLAATIEQAMHLQDRVAAEMTLVTRMSRRSRLHRLYVKIGEAIPVFRQFRINGPRFEETSEVGSLSGLIRRLEVQAQGLLLSSTDGSKGTVGGSLDVGDWETLKEQLASEPLPELSGLSLRETSRLLSAARNVGEMEVEPKQWVLKRLSECAAVCLSRRLMRRGVPESYRLVQVGASSPHQREECLARIVTTAGGSFRSRSERDVARRFLPELVELLIRSDLLSSDGGSLPGGRELARPAKQIELYRILLVEVLDEIARRFGELAGRGEAYRMGRLWLHLLQNDSSSGHDSLQFSRSVTAVSRLLAPDLPKFGVERIWLGYGLPAFIGLGLVELRWGPPRSKSSTSGTTIRSSPLLSRGIVLSVPKADERDSR